jgi:LuxR family maltose regulon positive regulatory protein
LGQTTLGKNSLPPESIRHLKGEISALKSLLYYYQTDVERTIAESEFSVRNTPPELWIVRILARLFLGGAFLMRGDLRRAYATIYQGADEEDVQSHAFRATMLITVCNIHWVVANLQGLLDAANQSLKLYDYPYSAEIEGYAHYYLGCAYYHLNDLAAAEEHFAAVVQQPYLNYGDGFAHSAFGLSLAYQAQNRPDDASQVAALAVAHMIETGNTTLLPVAKAFQAELALRQGQLTLARQWAAQFDSIPPLSPLVRFYQPHLTLVRIWLARDTPASRQQVAEALDQLKSYAELTHNTVVLIMVLALLSVLHAAEDDEPAALNQLEKAIELAEPGGFVRLFLDLGPPMARLLRHLHGKGVYSNYISKILAAFEGDSRRPPSAVVGQPEPLTPREMEVLEFLARRLTNKEIAARLVISPGTVKTHTLNIYAKLDVHGRRQAVNKARELGLLPPS